MTEPVIIGSGAVKFVPNATTFMKTLTFPTPNSGTRTLHDEDDVDYQVPIGKKFIILKIMSSNGYNGIADTNFSIQIWKNTIIDSIVGGTRFYFRNGGQGSVSPFGTPYTISAGGAIGNDEVFYTIPSGSYVNAVLGANIGLQVIGVECDV